MTIPTIRKENKKEYLEQGDALLSKITGIIRNLGETIEEKEGYISHYDHEVIDLSSLNVHPEIAKAYLAAEMHNDTEEVFNERGRIDTWFHHMFLHIASVNIQGKENVEEYRNRFRRVFYFGFNTACKNFWTFYLRIVFLFSYAEKKGYLDNITTTKDQAMKYLNDFSDIIVGCRDCIEYYLNLSKEELEKLEKLKEKAKDKE